MQGATLGRERPFGSRQLQARPPFRFSHHRAQHKIDLTAATCQAVEGCGQVDAIYLPEVLLNHIQK